MSFNFESARNKTVRILCNQKPLMPDWNSYVGRWILNETNYKKDINVNPSLNTWSKEGEPDPGNDAKYRFPLITEF